uniref:SERTA domain-containing protein n=1 Tax=Knipowitschia caucasica TaxID=637954 RepID=A0AAV2JM00_KNICA
MLKSVRLKKARTMFPKGTKRKSPEDEAPGPGPLSYSLQRQSLLDMSLIKLQLCHMLVEPDLCRSVLIANTVRQIQEEMSEDGTWQRMALALAQGAQGPQGPSGLAPPLTPSPERLVASELLCRSDLKPAPHRGEGGLEERAPGAPDSPDSPYLGPFSRWEGDEGEEGEEGDSEEADEADSEDSLSDPEEEVREHTVFGTFEIKPPLAESRGPSAENRGPSAESRGPSVEPARLCDIRAPSDAALEELFSDVDPSYYDLDTVLLQGPKMGPYDLLESLSHSPALSPAPTANCRSDINELDHIMEIIVGS